MPFGILFEWLNSKLYPFTWNTGFIETSDEFTAVYSWTCPKNGVYAFFAQSLYAAKRPNGIQLLKDNAILSAAESNDYLQIKTWAVQNIYVDQTIVVKEKLTEKDGKLSGYGFIVKL